MPVAGTAPRILLVVPTYHNAHILSSLTNQFHKKYSLFNGPRFGRVLKNTPMQGAQKRQERGVYEKYVERGDCQRNAAEGAFFNILLDQTECGPTTDSDDRTQGTWVCYNAENNDFSARCHALVD